MSPPRGSPLRSPLCLCSPLIWHHSLVWQSTYVFPYLSSPPGGGPLAQELFSSPLCPTPACTKLAFIKLCQDGWATERFVSSLYPVAGVLTAQRGPSAVEQVLEKQSGAFNPGLTSWETHSISPAETCPPGPPVLVGHVPPWGLLLLPATSPRPSCGLALVGRSRATLCSPTCPPPSLPSVLSTSPNPSCSKPGLHLFWAQLNGCPMRISGR